jgi:hypothetical protein
VFALVWIAWANGHGEWPDTRRTSPAVILTASRAQAAALAVTDSLVERFGAFILIVAGEPSSASSPVWPASRSAG